MELEELSSYNELKQWPILSSVEDDLLRQVRLAYVFGRTYSHGLLVTKHDKVYSVGYAVYGQKTRYGKRPRSKSAVLDHKLSGKGFAKFSAGTKGHFIIGLTMDGRIYGCGENDNNQLGFARSEIPVEPVEIKIFQEGETPTVVVDIACGARFAVALTAQGDIFTWGTNYLRRQGENKCVTKEQPTKLMVPSKIVSVACSDCEIVALTEAGMVLCWELGDEWFTEPQTPSNLENIIVTKVAAGYDHFIALTKDNCVFCWKSNTDGKLGVTSGVWGSSKSDCFVDIDIAAKNSHDVFMARDSKGLVHVWGEVRGGPVKEPFATPFRSFSMAFRKYTDSEDMPQTVKVKLPTGLSLLDSMIQMFDNRETADLKFVDQTNGKAIYVHKAFLMGRSDHFTRMFGNGWKENGQSELPIPTQFGFSVYRSFLRYLYTDEVVVDEDDVIQFLGLANYIMDSNMAMKCCDFLVRRMTVENAAAYFQASLFHNNRDLEDKSFRFCIQHLKEVIATEGYANLEKETLNKLIAKIALLKLSFPPKRRMIE